MIHRYEIYRCIAPTALMLENTLTDEALVSQLDCIARLHRSSFDAVVELVQASIFEGLHMCKSKTSSISR